MLWTYEGNSIVTYEIIKTFAGLDFVGPYYLTHAVNFPCGRKPEYPEKTNDFRQRIDYTLSTRGLGSIPP